MQLLTVATTAQRDALSAEVQGGLDGYGNIWVGLESVDRKPTRNKADFRWISNGRNLTVDWWAGGEPNNYGGVEGVCGLQGGPLWNGELLTIQCMS
jgi:hypothetical protein